MATEFGFHPMGQFPEALRDSVSFLCVENKGEFAVIGTCFSMAIEEDNQLFVYIITCKHVVKDFVDRGLPIFIRLNRSDILDVGYPRLPDGWIYHNDPNVDVAVLPFVRKADKSQPFEWNALSANLLMIPDEELARQGIKLREGMDVFFMGLFTPYYGTTRNLPIIRWGRISLISPELIETSLGYSRYFILECHTYPGNSGSPLYLELYRNGNTAVVLIGIVSSAYVQAQEVLRNPSGTTEVYRDFGISLAIPIVKAHEILWGDHLVQMRRKKIGARPLHKSVMPMATKVLEGEASPTFVKPLSTTLSSSESQKSGVENQDVSE